MTAPLRLGVAGVGSLGRHHARVAAQAARARVSGVFDRDADRARAVASEFSLETCRDLDELLENSDAIVVATPTASHHEIAARAIQAGRHVLVEKPMTATLDEADDLVALADSRGVVLQVGHIERFNPAVEAVFSVARNPRFIESHRLGVFTARSLDVDVVLDLMIHDLQITQALLGRRVVEVRAAGVAVLTPKIDIANARIAFEGGCVANLTASRVSAEKVRKYRIFAPSLYASIDMGAQEIGAFRLAAGTDGKTSIVPASIPVIREEPLKREIDGFIAACLGMAPPIVSGRDGRDALALALDVRDAIDEHQKSIS